jgi:5-methylcytosine-specific restriction endonuclease McrA
MKAVNSYYLIHGNYQAEIWQRQEGLQSKFNSGIWQVDIMEIGDDNHDNLISEITTSFKSALEYFVFVADEDNEWDGQSPIIMVKMISRKQYKSKSRRPALSHYWARLVKHRDNKCVECGSVDELHAHHVKSFIKHPELRYDVNNGITLCRICHNLHHAIHGK